MARVDTNLIAVVVSFVALFTTIIQALQPFFASTEGYRQCNPLANMKHKRWQWTEFPSETLQTTPECVARCVVVQSRDLGDEGSELDNMINLTALVVALVALLASVLQVVQQFFATAEGYRRCSSSVMGPWAKRTYKRWWWTEFRYETVYTTPEFFVGEASDLSRNESEVEITGDQTSLKLTMTPAVTPDRPKFRRHTLHSDEASWIPFLQALHEQSRENLKAMEDVESNIQFVSLPALSLHKRSWDFMPPDAVRPFASSSLSDMCILMRRLGMDISEPENFRPNDGILRAEGSGHVITSTMERGVGLVLKYLYLGGVKPSVNQTGNNTFIWKAQADQMGFGILPGNKDFSLPDFVIGTEEDVLARLSEIDPSLQARNHIENNLKVNHHWVTAFNDLIPLAAPMLRIWGCSTVRVPAPYRNGGGNGSVLTCSSAGFKSFHYQLQEMVDKDKVGINDRPQRILVLEHYGKLKEKYGEVWEYSEDSTEERRLPGGRTVDFLNDVHNYYEETTQYFQFLEKDHHSTTDNILSRFSYLDLVKAHIANAVFYWPECGKSKVDANGQERPHFDAAVVWHSEGMHTYFDFLPKYVKSMREAGCHDEELVKDAWVTLIFRAFCWHRCHLLIEGNRVPSQYYGSRQPVYIG